MLIYTFFTVYKNLSNLYIKQKKLISNKDFKLNLKLNLIIGYCNV